MEILCWSYPENHSIKISPSTLKKKFKDYFIENVGIEPYIKCLECEGELVPREIKHGRFRGCLYFPKCTFIATNIKPYKGNDYKKNKTHHIGNILYDVFYF